MHGMAKSESVKRRLAEIVAASGVQQVALARRVDRDKQWVYARLKGPADLSVEDIRVFAEALRVDVCDLACQLLRDGPAPELPPARAPLRPLHELPSAQEFARELTHFVGELTPEREALATIADALRRYLDERQSEPDSPNSRHTTGQSGT